MYNTKDQAYLIGQAFRILKMFSEGRTIRDKLILFPGAILRVVSNVLSYARIPFFPRFTYLASRPACDVMIKNKDGLFKCRKGEEDAMIAAEAYEYLLQLYFEGIESGIFVDIGANIGKYTIKVARRLKKRGQVIAIEPDPETFAVLKSNIILNNLENVVALNVACWKDNEDLLLDVSSPLGSGCYSVKGTPSCSIRVRGRKIDDLLRELNIDEVVFMKIDVEGAEVEVLEGARGTISRNKSMVTIVEVRNSDNLAAISSIFGEGISISEESRANFLIKRV